MLTEELKPGITVYGPLFPEPVQVIVAIPMGVSVKLVGKGAKSNSVYEPILNTEQLALLTAPPAQEPFDGDARKFRLGIEAMRLGLAYEYALEFDAVNNIAKGLGIHLEDLGAVVEISKGNARLLAVSERTQRLFGKTQEKPAKRGHKKAEQQDLFAELLNEAEADAAWRDKAVLSLGETTLDRVHQAMILFATGRGEALKRFLVDDGAGRDARFWKLANALLALYPKSSEENRWVDGVLARKKGLGL